MSRMRDINGAPDNTHPIPTKYSNDLRSWPRLRADDHSNQRHEYDSLGPWTLIMCLQALLLQILISTSPTAISTVSGFRWNDDLQKVVKLGDGFLKKPEDVCVDNKGTFYTVTRDGWAKRKHRNEAWENWKKLGGNALLGVAMSNDGHLLVCDANKASPHLIGFADDVIQASDGTIYFSDVSTKYGLSNWVYDVLEGKPHGRLLKYSPQTGHTSIHLNHLSFPNGVALSRKQDFLVVCETWKFRCLKHWLKGKLKGNTSIFVDNLPGGPDNINLAPDGSFWIALLNLRTSGTKELVLEGVAGKAMVMKVSEDGKMIRKLDDSRGKVMGFVTSALEFEEHLYLGNLNSTFIGRLNLNKIT
ncbi:hypothetical protein Syun_011571 [Stephania yunnanensis]|uniref:Strictosidine synthase conserved region domain-containing protein n=1 Tax=Stephania yunnanensis TaxID=152371 RepID=A0AAP0JY18_9MAGN